MWIRASFVLFGVAAVGAKPCPRQVTDVLVARLAPKEISVADTADTWLKEANSPANCELGADSVAKIQTAISGVGFHPINNRPVALRAAAGFVAAVVGAKHAKSVLHWTNPAYAKADMNRGLFCGETPIPAATVDDLIVFLDMARGCARDPHFNMTNVYVSPRLQVRARPVPPVCASELGAYVARKVGESSPNTLAAALRDESDRQKSLGCPSDGSELLVASVPQSAVSPILEAVLAKDSLSERKVAAAAVLDYLPALTLRPNFFDALQTLAVEPDAGFYSPLCKESVRRLRMDQRAATVELPGYVDGEEQTRTEVNYLVILLRALETVASCAEEDTFGAETEVRVLQSLESRETRFVRQLGELRSMLMDSGAGTMELVAMVQLINALTDVSNSVMDQLIANAQYERENDDMIEETLVVMGDVLDVQRRAGLPDRHSSLHHMPKAVDDA